MTTPIIPLELQELIIDSVQDRDHALFTETLKSCCLTCRAWLPRSIRRLYHRLIVGNLRPAQFDKLVRLIDTSPYVADAIEELVVGVVFQGTEDVVGGVAIRAVLAGKLPRLRSLTLIGSGSLVQSAPPPLVVSSPPCRLPTLAGFPTLTTLHLSFVFFTSYVSFQRMFSSVPALRRLHASYVICNHTRIPPAFPSYPPLIPPLTHVVWYENATSAMLSPTSCGMYAGLSRTSRFPSPTRRNPALIKRSLSSTRIPTSSLSASPAWVRCGCARL
ncbi:hypothetical protein L226DRAFT_261315 [Lentinus tigrinus ALCF2SS1-7]|uniref:uncharacterized protein n=1 Tax=Lentinus tigrinus ALCF2SS1-7 TaxID=1328758 RepID=UPI0011661EC2|nr:hypothetical protein L226DRAFT_261315 [Lentinus tigrinus ALCF2SS1-7]